MKPFLLILTLILSPLPSVEAEEQKELFTSDIPELIQSELPVPLLEDILPALQLVLPSLNHTIPIAQYQIMYYCKLKTDTQTLQYVYQLTENKGSNCKWEEVDFQQVLVEEKRIPINNQGQSDKYFYSCRETVSNMINNKISEGYLCHNQSFFVAPVGRKRMINLF